MVVIHSINCRKKYFCCAIVGGENWKGFLRFWKCALDNNGEDENFFEGDAERILPAKLYLPGLLADTQFGNRMKNAVHRIVLWITTQHFLCLLWWIRGESGGKP